MNLNIVLISILVRDYDEAVEFYTQKLNFDLMTDQKLSDTKRWVIVKPKGSGSCSLLLAKANGDEQQKSIGNQSGGRVFLFLNTDDFERDYNQLLRNGIKIARGPSEETYGKVLVFEDLYGNKWDLIQPG